MSSLCHKLAINRPSELHSLTVPSSPATATILPSRLKLSQFTGASCSIVRSRVPSVFQSLIVLSLDALAIVCPLGLKATLVTLLVWPVKVVSKVPSVCQILTVLSKLAEAMILLSGLNATQATLLVWPLKVVNKLPSRRQSLTVLSTLEEAIVWPSGLKARPQTTSPCPSKRLRSLTP